MSVELSNRSVIYLNLSKTGKEHDNGGPTQQHCSVNLSFRDVPLLDDQSDFVCAISRFQCPLSEIPTIQECSFSLYKYPKGDLFAANGDMTADYETFDQAWRLPEDNYNTQDANGDTYGPAWRVNGEIRDANNLPFGQGSPGAVHDVHPDAVYDGRLVKKFQAGQHGPDTGIWCNAKIIDFCQI